MGFQILVIHLSLIPILCQSFPLSNFEFVSTRLPSTHAIRKSSDTPRSCTYLTIPWRDSQLQLCLKKPSRESFGNSQGKVLLFRSGVSHPEILPLASDELVEGFVMGHDGSSVFGYIYLGCFYGRIRFGSQHNVNLSLVSVTDFRYLIDSSDTWTSQTSTNNAIIYDERDVYIPMKYYNTTRTYTKPKKVNLGITNSSPHNRWRPYYYERLGNYDSRDIYNRSRQYGLVCPLLIVADYTFVSLAANNDSRLAAVRLSFMIQESDAFFRAQDFNFDGRPDNIGFNVSQIWLYLDDGSGSFPKLHWNDETKTYSSLEYLMELSRLPLDDYCLAVAFTHRNFDEGVLGLSWMASPDDTDGICEKRRFVRDLGEQLNLNSLMVNVKSYDHWILPPHILLITLVHELGHSFGAPHDNSHNPACLPGSDTKDGNYLMAETAQDGTKRRHWVFSACSKDKIAKTLIKRARCLRPTLESYCGNGVVEPGEECDCGAVTNCLMEKCCGSRHSGRVACRVRRNLGYSCSRSHGPCCDSTCRWKNLSHLGITCGTDHDSCCISGNCSSRDSWAPNGTSCGPLVMGGTSCWMGTCQSSSCTRLGLLECACHGGVIQAAMPYHLCGTCCLIGSKCLPAEQVTNELFFHLMEKLMDAPKNIGGIEWLQKDSPHLWELLNRLPHLNGTIMAPRLKVKALASEANVLYLSDQIDLLDDYDKESHVYILQKRYCLNPTISDIVCQIIVFHFWKEHSSCVSLGMVGRCHHSGICILPKYKGIRESPQTHELHKNASSPPLVIAPTATIVILLALQKFIQQQ